MVEILHRDKLKRGGFGGLKETRLVMDRRVFEGKAENGTWEGIGNFVYLADACFMPKGETGLHSHYEIDVISVMVEGRIAHEGSLKHGQSLDSHDIQAQRAGSEGFSHNEINPDDKENRLIQIWVLPERTGGPSSYKLYHSKGSKLTRVHGGSTDQDETFDGQTLIDVGLLAAGEDIMIDGPFLVYVTRGSGHINDETVGDGNLIRGENLAFKAREPTQLIVVHTG